jgi:integrase
MASVHKRPESKFWHAAWRTSDGQLRLRSTKKTNRTEALSIAADWERIDKKVASGEMAESQVRKVVNDILERAGHSPLEVPSIRKWCTEWLQEKESSKTSGTAERYKYVIDAFLIHLKDRADKPLSALTSRDVQGYVTKRIGQRVSNATVNVDGKILRTCFNRARRQGLIPINPAEAVDLPSKRSVERGTFTAAEVKMLIDACKKDEWKTVILFGYFTGARLGDCTRIEWKNLNLGNRTLTFFEGKNQKNIVMPLHPDLANHLEKIATSDKPEKFVTPKLAEASTGGQHGMSESFKRIVNNAGLDLQTVQGTGVRMISKRTFHALRHSFTSALANAGVSPELRMKLTGHKSAEIHRGYTHLEMETLKEVIGPHESCHCW